MIITDKKGHQKFYTYEYFNFANISRISRDEDHYNGLYTKLTYTDETTKSLYIDEEAHVRIVEVAEELEKIKLTRHVELKTGNEGRHIKIPDGPDK